MQKDDFNKLKQEAREADLLSYFQKSGYTIERHGREYYVKEFPGLCINPDEKKWYSHYQKIGRINNSIDCLTELMGKSFNQAVYELTGTDISTARSYDYPKKQAPDYTSPPMQNFQKTKRTLDMPPSCENMRRVFAYLCKTRKIPAAVVEEFVHAGLLYQSQKTDLYKSENAVFVHKNADGQIVGGEVQGINSYKRFKGIVPGTGDSVVVFTPNPAKDGKIKRAYLFESAIDLMSFYAMCNKKNKLMEGAAFISMAGLKPSVPKQLEAQGVQIISCVDNDDKGREFEANNGFVRSESVKKHLDAYGFKDWNDLLVFQTENPNVSLMEVQQRKSLSDFFRRDNS